MAGLLMQNTPGDRQEIRRMLSALSPLDRLAFLCDCCLRLNVPGTMASARNMPLKAARRCDAADARVTDMVYADLLFAATQHNLDLDAAVTRLAGYVARPAALRESATVRRAVADALAVSRRCQSPA